MHAILHVVCQQRRERPGVGGSGMSGMERSATCDRPQSKNARTLKKASGASFQKPDGLLGNLPLISARTGAAFGSIKRASNRSMGTPPRPAPQSTLSASRPIQHSSASDRSTESACSNHAPMNASIASYSSAAHERQAASESLPSTISASLAFEGSETDTSKIRGRRYRKSFLPPTVRKAPDT